MKACFVDNVLLPSDCVLDHDDDVMTCGCTPARVNGYKSKYECPYWQETVSLQLAQRILGDEYMINKRLPDITNPCTYTTAQVLDVS